MQQDLHLSQLHGHAYRKILRSSAVALVVSWGVVLTLPKAASATPLHGLSAVFSDQVPERYRQRIRQLADKMEAQRVRGGTIEDLKKRQRSSRAGTSDAPRESGGEDSSPGRVENSRVRRPTTPQLIRRDLSQKRAKSLFEADPRQAVVMQARMQALELTEVLAYFNAENVNWDGHMGPQCDYPGFRQAALDGLRSLADVGAEAVVQAAGQELTAVTIPREVANNPASYASVFDGVYRGQSNNPLTRDRRPVGDIRGMTPEQIVQRTLLMNPTYHDDLVTLLKEFAADDMLSDEMRQYLKTCASGKKDNEVRQLAENLRPILRFVDKDALERGDVQELLDAWDMADERSRTEIATALRRRLPELSVTQAFSMVEKSPESIRPAVLRELTDRSPKYSEVSSQLDQICRLAQSEDKQVAEVAQAHVINAFQRAPMSQCLLWLGRGDDRLNAVIWNQVDARIQRADPARRAGYRDVAIAVLKHKEVKPGAKHAALDLLDRLKDRQAVGPLAGALVDLPRELCPRAGEVLRNITGQDFGPREGQSIVEVHVAAGKWQKWAEEKGDR